MFKIRWTLDFYTNLMRTLPQWLLWGSCKNLHVCISTLVISGTSLSYTPTFQHILHLFINFKLVSDSSYCYLCWWWCIIFNPPTSLNFNNSPLSNKTSVTTYVHRMIISPPCLFRHMKNDERFPAVCFFSVFWIIHNNNCISVSLRCWEVTFQSVYTSMRHTLCAFSLQIPTKI